jgi:hypothetical protein
MKAGRQVRGDLWYPIRPQRAPMATSKKAAYAAIAAVQQRTEGRSARYLAEMFGGGSSAVT